MYVIRSRGDYTAWLSPPGRGGGNRRAIVVNHRQGRFVIGNYDQRAEKTMVEMGQPGERRVVHAGERDAVRRCGGCLPIPPLLLDGSSIDLPLNYTSPT